MTSNSEGSSGTDIGNDIDGGFVNDVSSPPMSMTRGDVKLKKPRIAVLASGRGSDFQALIDAWENGSVSYEICLLLTNNPEAFALERARAHSIPVKVIDHKGKDRVDFDMEIHKTLLDMEIDLVVLAGFMRILSGDLVKLWKDRIVNIHPALLPSFPGAHAHRDVIEYGVKVSGLTIHFVDEKMDHGPIIFQLPVKVMDGDTEETLGIRVLEKEHEWYPVMVDIVARGKYVIKGRNVTILEELPDL